MFSDIELELDVYKAFNKGCITESEKDECIMMIESAKDNELQFNLNKWKRGTSTNVLFITGLSGSGKSTLASKMAKENDAIHVEVDLLEHNSILFDDNIIDYDGKKVIHDKGNIIMKEYMQKTYGGAKKFQVSDTASFTKEVIKFIVYMLKYAKEHKDELFIVEGIQVADSTTWNLSNTKSTNEEIRKTLEMSMKLMDLVSQYPVIIKNTSVLQSIYRAAKREGDVKEYFKSFNSIQSIKEYIQFYMEMRKNKNQFIKNMKKSNS